MNPRFDDDPLRPVVQISGTISKKGDYLLDFYWEPASHYRVEDICLEVAGDVQNFGTESNGFGWMVVRGQLNVPSWQALEMRPEAIERVAANLALAEGIGAAMRQVSNPWGFPTVFIGPELEPYLPPDLNVEFDTAWSGGNIHLLRFSGVGRNPQTGEIEVYLSDGDRFHCRGVGFLAEDLAIGLLEAVQAWQKEQEHPDLGRDSMIAV